MKKDVWQSIVPQFAGFFVICRKVNMKQTTKYSIRIIAGTGMLAAVAVVLQYLEIPVFIMPGFIKLDFSDLPELIAAFAYGPISGILVALLKNAIHMLVSQSGFVGELSNFILGSVFALTAGLVYKLNKTKRGAVTAGITASVVMAAVSIYSNLFVIYPIYYKLFGGEQAILSLYQKLLPSVRNMAEAVIIFNVPFTLVKGLICVVICMFIYKPLSKLLKGKNTCKNENNPV